MLTFKQIATKCMRSEQEIKLIFDQCILRNDGIMENYLGWFEKVKKGQYVLKDEHIEDMKGVVSTFIRVRYVGNTTILGHTLRTYENNSQKFYDISDICDIFGITLGIFYNNINFYDIVNAIVVNYTKDSQADKIHSLVTEHGVFLLIYLYMQQKLDQLNQDQICA